MTPFLPNGLPVICFLPPLVVAIAAVYAATRYELRANILRGFWHSVPRVAGFLVGVYLFLAFLWLNWPSWVYAIVVSGLVIYIFAPQTLIRFVWTTLRAKPKAAPSAPSANPPAGSGR